ncbi:MAG: protein translocase subunit SecF [Clostridia bacterium]|nr:protein translocase subunit SecF [Clostridia bacterium]MBQ4608212.1 protein translocase subunit SecF [Clostridia bacterium]MBQ7052148.1 protein translocase subunit SecF [Clostridia bacterium]
MKFEMKNRLKPCAAVSVAIMVVALVMSMMGMGMNLGIDFTGGTLMTYNMGEAFDTAVVTDALSACGIADAQIAKTGEDNTQVQIRISDVENTDELRTQLEAKLAETYANIEYVDITRVGAVVGGELINNAIKSLTLAAVLMLLYIAVRFDLYSGLAAVIGLVHDIAIMMSFVVILRGFIRVETTFIAALLTIVGYSINNTIIIFDRIRENSHKVGVRQLPRDEIVNISIKESLPRTLNTTITTLLTIVTLYVLGVDSIKQFALPLIIGIISGTYSANMINGYVWSLLMDLRSKSRKNK